MASKKGVCPYCNTSSRIQNRIFRVNPEATTCFCPSCLREVEPKVAIDLYNSLIDKMIDKANNTLFVACDPVLAYQQYADVLEVEEDEYKALLGRILCLIYTSKVRKEYLSEAIELLEKIDHRGAGQIPNYIAALKKINFALDEYDNALLHRLTHKEFFYDEECLGTYLTRLTEIIKFKNEIFAKLKSIQKTHSYQDNEMLINLISHDLSQKEAFLTKPHHVVSGETYRFVKVYAGKVTIEKINEVVETKFKHHHMLTLKGNSKGRNAVKDEVFKDYTPIIHMKNIAKYFSVILFIASLALGALAFFFKEHEILFPLFVSCSAALVVVALVLFILYLSWRGILKKRKMRIA